MAARRFGLFAELGGEGSESRTAAAAASGRLCGGSRAFDLEWAMQGSGPGGAPVGRQPSERGMALGAAARSPGDDSRHGSDPAALETRLRRSHGGAGGKRHRGGRRHPSHVHTSHPARPGLDAPPRSARSGSEAPRSCGSSTSGRSKSCSTAAVTIPGPAAFAAHSRSTGRSPHSLAPGLSGASCGSSGRQGSPPPR